MRIRSLLLTALAVLLPAIALAAVLATVPIGRTDLKWWRDRHEEKLAEIHRGPVQLVWLGDSITQDWEKPAFQPIWQRFYGDRHAINLGFIGDTTSSVLWRIEHGELSGISPKVIVLLIGANNMGRPHWDASETVQGIEAIIAQIHERLPQTKVLLLSVLPSDRSAWITETTAEINRMLAARYGAHQDGQVTYLDVTHVFMRDGKLDESLFLDPTMTPPEPALHPSPQGQAAMAAAMEPTLSTMLGDQPRK